MAWTIDEILDRASVMPVLTVEYASQAAQLAEALAVGGLKVVEVTLRTPAACAALQAMKDAAPGLIVGMGTVRSARDVAMSVEAGADFLVTPGMTPALRSAFTELDTPVLPGASTPSEVMTLFELGFQAQKLFPAEQSGGVAYLKALAGPIPEVTFCPTGSITRELAPTYLALPNVACVGGSWIATPGAIAAKDWGRITENARIAASLKP